MRGCNEKRTANMDRNRALKHYLRVRIKRSQSIYKTLHLVLKFCYICLDTVSILFYPCIYACLLSTCTCLVGWDTKARLLYSWLNEGLLWNVSPLTSRHKVYTRNQMSRSDTNMHHMNHTPSLQLSILLTCQIPWI